MHVLITRKIPKKYVDQLKKFHHVEMFKESNTPMPRQAFLEKSKTADIVITMLSDKVDNEYLTMNPHLLGIVNLAVGYDNIDVEYAKTLGIKICHTPDVLTETTAELAFTLMLVCARRIPEALDLVKNGEWTGWSPYLMAGKDVYNQTIGIYGMGKIGHALAKRCQGLNMNILYHNRRPTNRADVVGATFVDFNTLLSDSDFVVCTAPLTKETQGIFDRDAFNKMKNSAIFINIGRGAHVNEMDLLEAVQQNDIYAAGVDVLTEEPIRNDHPFLKESRITILPHIGSASENTRDAMIQLCIDNVQLILNGNDPKTEVK